MLMQVVVGLRARSVLVCSFLQGVLHADVQVGVDPVISMRRNRGLRVYQRRAHAVCFVPIRIPWHGWRTFA